LRPSPPTRPAETAWQVFLSSTIRDLESYRRGVQDALLTKAEVAVFLSEDWPGGYDDTVAKCRARVEGSHGFFLLMGYWYGSIPPGFEKSITHLELEWALGKWGREEFPPLAVFSPTPQSPAEKELRDAAAPLLPAGDEERKRHDGLLDAFRAQVTGSWRTVRSFKDQQDLREHAIVSCLIWKRKTFAAATRAEAATASPGFRLAEEDFGSLGRKKQLDAVDEVLVELSAHPEEPAVCLLVSGNEDAGQRAFLAHLVTTVSFRHGRPAQPGRPLSGSYGTDILTAWATQSLGLTGGGEVKSPAELAERVAAELKRQPLALVLDQIHRMNGGVAAFQDTFWKPFYDRLKELRAGQPIPHRLIAVVAEHTGDSATWRGAACGPDFEEEPADFSKLALLPALEPFKQKDLLRWLGEIEVPEERRLAIAGRVLTNSQGQPDPTPLRVFERLRGEDLRPEDEDE
jgi:hypothetical protein